MRAGQDAVQGRHRGALYSLPFPPGSISWFELSIAALGPADAMDREFIVLARDVTARQQAEAPVQVSVGPDAPVATRPAETPATTEAAPDAAAITAEPEIRKAGIATRMC